MTHADAKRDSGTVRRPWTTPRVVYRGGVTEIIRSGGAKASTPVDGDGRKPGGAG